MYDLWTIEKAIDPSSVPGLSIVKLRNGLETGTYSIGTYGQYDKYVDANTVYDLASVTKLYTTALILRQVQKGAMNLDDKFSKYLPQPFKTSSITVRDLLSHRVDFGVGLTQCREEFSDDFKTALLNIQVPDGPSGKVNYHNLGYIYLGYALEKVSSGSLTNQMKSFFLDLGLNNTYTGDSIADVGIKCPATELLSDNSVLENITHDESARLHGGLAGNAGVFASARDLAKFGWSWLSGQIVHEDLFKEVLKNHDKAGDSPQGLGWWMRLKDGTVLPEGVYGHHGFTGCYLAIDTSNSEVISITTNRTFMGRDNMGDQDIWKAVLFQA